MNIATKKRNLLVCSVCYSTDDIRFTRASQSSPLTEEIEAHSHKVIFYPKFHCELNPIEPYWCKAKWYTESTVTTVLKDYVNSIPKALASLNRRQFVYFVFFNRSMSIIKAYRDGLQYGCEEFKL